MNPSGSGDGSLFLLYPFFVRSIPAQINMVVTDVATGLQVSTDLLTSMSWATRYSVTNSMPDHQYIRSALPRRTDLRSNARDHIAVPAYFEGWQEKSQVLPAGTTLTPEK